MYTIPSRSSRSRAVANASGLRSPPTKRRPRRAAATSVVPLPHMRSATVAPGAEDARTMRSSSRSGFCVG
ncbi:hypothetical protein WME73_50710 [Sorangium sp. So ce302]|uniref:hypothetical protein n=1 Tax=Sorangium sp. So ce302 TaxID=3133297 RepID=UPI003F6110F2